MVTRQLQVRCRPGKVRRSETDVLPLSYTPQTVCVVLQRWVVAAAVKRRNYDLGGGASFFDDSAGFTGTYKHRDADEIFREFFGGKDPFEAFFGNKDPFEVFFANSGKTCLFIKASMIYDEILPQKRSYTRTGKKANVYRFYYMAWNVSVSMSVISNRWTLPSLVS